MMLMAMAFLLGKEVRPSGHQLTLTGFEASGTMRTKLDPGPQHLQRNPRNPRNPAIIALLKLGFSGAAQEHCLRWQIFAQPPHPPHVSHRNRVNLASGKILMKAHVACHVADQWSSNVQQSIQLVSMFFALGTLGHAVSWCFYVT